MLVEPLADQFHVLLARVHPRGAQVRRAWETVRDRKEYVARFGDSLVPSEVLPSELVDPAIENLVFRATGEVPILLPQRYMG